MHVIWDNLKRKKTLFFLKKKRGFLKYDLCHLVNHLLNVVTFKWVNMSL